MSEKQLTHREIWDDSTIVNSWEYLLNEYKKYHSIEATGGDLEAAVKEFAKKQEESAKSIQASETQTTAPEETSTPSGPSNEGNVAAPAVEGQHDGEVVMEDVDQSAVSPIPTASQTSNANGITGSAHPTSPALTAPISEEQEEQSPSTLPKNAAVPQPPPFPVMPGTNLAENEEMKNMMMAWYYAGYYTGLQEGQQKAQQQQQQQQQQK